MALLSRRCRRGGRTARVPRGSASPSGVGAVAASPSAPPVFPDSAGASAPVPVLPGAGGLPQGAVVGASPALFGLPVFAGAPAVVPGLLVRLGATYPPFRVVQKRVRQSSRKRFR